MSEQDPFYIPDPVIPLGPQAEIERLRVELVEAKRKLAEVDDVLIVNWIPITDDYRKNLAELVKWEIQIHDDPAVSEIAKKRQDELAEARKDSERFDWELEHPGFLFCSVATKKWHHLERSTGNWSYGYSTKREAIDAAMKES